MTSSAAPVGDLPSVIAGIRSGIGEAAELVDTIINLAKAVLSELAPEVSGPVLAVAVESQLWLHEQITGLGHALSHVGDPDALRTVGAAWATDIGGTASNFAGFASANTTRAGDYWTGDAAEAYTNALRPQKVALQAIKDTCDEMGTVLNALANAIFNFAISVGLTVAGLVAGLAVAAATAPTLAGTPIAIAATCGAVATFSAGVHGLISSLMDIVSDANTQSSEVNQRLANNVAFYGGAWPPATRTTMSDGTVVEKMSDGSVTDGDTTDWNIK